MQSDGELPDRNRPQEAIEVRPVAGSDGRRKTAGGSEKRSELDDSVRQAGDLSKIDSSRANADARRRDVGSAGIPAVGNPGSAPELRLRGRGGKSLSHLGKAGGVPFASTGRTGVIPALGFLGLMEETF